MNQYQLPRGFGGLTLVVKNLIIINGLFFLATIVFEPMGLDLRMLLGAHYFESTLFEPYQIVTHMFMHGSGRHIFFNMLALWMFGSSIERFWGPKKFLIYYLITGFGAFLIHYAVIFLQLQSMLADMSPEVLELIRTQGAEILSSGKNYTDPFLFELNKLYNGGIIGASGAVFGILLAFGMLFPNVILFPIPIKAKYFVVFFGTVEFMSAIANKPDDNIAHFAHLGGMIFGYFLIKYWRKHPFNG